MKRLTRTLLAGAMLAVPFVAVGSTSPVEAYCEAEPVSTTDGGGDSRCTNSCIETARLYQTVTGREAPWYCPM